MAELRVTNADLRVFDRLRSEIDAFDLEMTELAPLVDRIGVLLDQFEAVPPGVVEDLRQIWWPAQYTLAVSRDEERVLSAEEEVAIRDAVAVLDAELSDLDLSPA